ncbi:betA [Symbiodinium necroappetens]|uniref:BetA protein n=1 Tax=Symbiodinium necroappetens TaxID=1628268 RepID=A0A812SXN2_9DINO|nr:betA [Symbiodinium necroappetens]
MKLAFTVLAAGLAVTEGDQVVQQRPTFRKPFPDPALFRRSRRLAQEGGKPERLRFEVEDGGYQFNYEFAGASKVEHVFNLDSEGVHGIRCTAGRENHLEIFWANLTAAAAAALRKDAVISGSPEWQCSFSIPAKSRNSRIQSSGPLLRVMEVEALATSRSLCTRLRVVPTSPVEIFRDLYIDLSWHPVGRSADRRLRACSTDHHYSLNYDCESQRASQSHVVGPFTCSNCYALLDITPDFKLQTNSLGQPTRISLQLSATFEANLELGLNGPQSVSSNWTQLFSQRTGNLLNTIGFVMPMFGTLVSAINSWTVNMGIFANYELKGQADVRSILQGVLQTKRVYEWTGAEVGWTSSEGFFYTLGTVSSSGNTSTPDLKDFSADLAVDLAPCVSLDLNYDQEIMSSASACLEGNVAYVTQRATTSVAADAVSGTSQANDEQLCVDLYTQDMSI